MSDNINMGIGALGNPDTIFSRKFRWTFGSTSLPQEFMRNVKFDYANRIIKFSYYDIVSKDGGMQALVWADKIPDEDMIFTTYDGCGNPLYTLVFSGITLINHEANFDYESSDVATTELTIKYDNIHKKLIGCPDVFKRHKWKICLPDPEGTNEVEYDFKWRGDQQRPNLNIEEVEVNHLNAMMFLPGKAKWSNLELELPWGVYEQMNGKKTDMSLKLYINDKMVEMWQLHDCWIDSASFDRSRCMAKIYFASVQYSNNIA